MTVTRRVLLVALGVVLGACSAGTGPTTSPTAPVASAQVTQAAATAAPSAPPSTTAKPAPKPTPARSPVPVPPKPTGVKFDEEIESLCTDDPREMCGIGDSTYTVSWKTPRTRGIEVRVYGLLECLSMPDNPPASSTGPCLVKGTPLPASTKRLIAKVKASAGHVSWKVSPFDQGCDLAESVQGPGKERFYAIVLAAYNAAGKPSVFAIAFPGAWWMPGPDDMPC